MPGPSFHRHTLLALVVAWLLTGAGAAMLLWGYPGLPDVVPVYRLPWADTPTMSPKSLVTVGRIAVMGVGQVGAATAMVLSARGVAPWERFWRWVVLLAGTKTLLVCAAFLMAPGSTLERALSLAAALLVAAFLLSALGWWRRGDLRFPPKLVGSRRVWLVASLALWAAAAVAPRVLA